MLKSISGPLRLSFGCAGVQLATVAALGLKPLSVGPLNEYREGWSYRKGGSTPMVTAGARSMKMKECALEGESNERSANGMPEDAQDQGCRQWSLRRMERCLRGSAVDTATILSWKPDAGARACVILLSKQSLSTASVQLESNISHDGSRMMASFLSTDSKDAPPTSLPCDQGQKMP